MMYSLKSVLPGVVLAILCSTAIAEQEIRVGMSTALSGPARALGQSMKVGVEACFSQVKRRWRGAGEITAAHRCR